MKEKRMRVQNGTAEELHNETYREKALRERRKRKRIRQLRRFSFYFTMFSLIIAVCVLTMTMRIETTRLTNEISAKEAEIVELNSQYTTLIADQGTSMTLDEVEEYAKNQLGMVSFDRSQEEYLAVARQDQVVVDKGSSGVDKLVSGLVRSFNAALSFLR